MAHKKSAEKDTKKQLKKELAGKIEMALPELKISLGEKKFNKRVKKVTGVLTQGLHLNGNGKKNDKKIFSTNGIKTNTLAYASSVETNASSSEK